MKVVTGMTEKEVIKMLASEHIHSMSDADIAVKEQIINNLDIVENAEIHDENFCPYDLWAPQVDKTEDVKFSCFGNPIEELKDTVDEAFRSVNPRRELKHINDEVKAAKRRREVENVAFSAYAKHTQETEDIIKTIIAAYHNGETNFSLELDDDFSQGDLEYIEREVKRRIEAGY